jgi:Initiator Replication protein
MKSPDKVLCWVFTLRRYFIYSVNNPLFLVSPTALQIIEQASQLKKHIGTVHIAAPLSLLQRKAFSVLLFNAYPKLASQRTHSVSTEVLCELLGYGSNDVLTLRRALRALVTTPIEWVGADSDRWAVTTFLSYFEISGGMCHYRYDEFLAEKLYHPEVYARINLGVLQKFECKYAIALYENCARYRPNGGFSGGTPEWSLDEFRLIMGVRDVPLYGEFKRINAKIIQPALKEINVYSDIILTPVLRREGRSFVGIRFDVKDNPQMSFSFVAEGPAKDPKEVPGVIKMCDRYGVPEGVALAWLNGYGQERFQEVLDMADDEAVKGSLRNPVGFITWAFEKGAVKGRSVEEIQREVQAEKRHTAEKQKKKQQASVADSEEQRKQEAIYDRFLRQSARARFETLPTIEQAGIIQEWLSQEGSYLKQKFGNNPSLEELGPSALFLMSVLIRKWKLDEATPMSAWAALNL